MHFVDLKNMQRTLITRSSTHLIIKAVSAIRAKGLLSATTFIRLSFEVGHSLL